MNTWRASDRCLCVCVFVFPVLSHHFLLFLIHVVQWFPEHQAGKWIATWNQITVLETHVVEPSGHRETWLFQVILQSWATGSKAQLRQSRRVTLCLEFLKNSISFATCCGVDAILCKMLPSLDASTACILWGSHLFVSDMTGGGREKRGEGAAWSHLHFKRGAREVLRAYRAEHSQFEKTQRWTCSSHL